jgi:hypothetical protein
VRDGRESPARGGGVRRPLGPTRSTVVLRYLYRGVGNRKESS